MARQSNHAVTLLPAFKPQCAVTARLFSCRKMLEGKMQKKSHLLRSVVYVMLFAAVCLTSLALAQRNSSKSSQKTVGVTTPTATPTPGPCQFQVLIVFSDAGAPT